MGRRDDGGGVLRVWPLTSSWTAQYRDVIKGVLGLFPRSEEPVGVGNGNLRYA